MSEFGRHFQHVRLAWTFLAGLSVPSAALADNPWIEVQSEHFKVYAMASERRAREWTLAMEQFVSGLRGAIGDTTQRPRVTVLLFGSTAQFRPYKPTEDGKPKDVDGLFTRNQDISVIADCIGRRSDETRRLIQHEAVHWYAAGRAGMLPLWVDEGLAETYSTFEMVDDQHGVFGAPINGYPAMLRSKNFRSLAPIVNAGRDSLLFNDFAGRQSTRIFYAEAWALVHYLIFGGDLSGGKRLDNYIRQIHQGVAPDVAFRKEIGEYGTVEESLRRYVAADTYRSVRVAVPSAEISSSLRVSPAKAPDVELALGSLLVAVNRIDAAEPHLQRSLALAGPPGDPFAWEALGQVSLVRGDYREALGYFRKAVGAGSSSTWVIQQIARLSTLRFQ